MQRVFFLFLNPEKRYIRTLHICFRFIDPPLKEVGKKITYYKYIKTLNLNANRVSCVQSAIQCDVTKPADATRTTLGQFWASGSLLNICYLAKQNYRQKADFIDINPKNAAQVNCQEVEKREKRKQHKKNAHMSFETHPR